MTCTARDLSSHRCDLLAGHTGRHHNYSHALMWGVEHVLGGTR